MEPVFRALSDPGRRVLLDRLFERDGQTLGELCTHLPGMTRFGVMSHLRVLESAELITTRRHGRQKLHYLNPVPIRRVHDRWISKFAEPVVGQMTALQRHLEEGPMSAPTHVFSLFIKTTPDALWRAITDGNDTARYYYGTRVASTWQPGAPLTYTYPDGSVAADGEILAIEPGRSVTLAFHARWDPEIDAEGPTRMTWAIEPAQDGLCRLLVTVDDIVPGSKTERDFVGGMPYIVSGLKTLLETGEPLIAAGVAAS